MFWCWILRFCGVASLVSAAIELGAALQWWSALPHSHFALASVFILAAFTWFRWSAREQAEAARAK